MVLANSLAKSLKMVLEMAREIQSVADTHRVSGKRRSSRQDRMADDRVHDAGHVRQSSRFGSDDTGLAGCFIVAGDL